MPRFWTYGYRDSVRNNTPPFAGVQGSLFCRHSSVERPDWDEDLRRVHDSGKYLLELINDDGQPFQMRIGINTGPVVAGVIGTKKFACDLWGDTVNLARRMESHAPTGGILVTESTYKRLLRSFTFSSGRLMRIKGKGELVTYLLVGRKKAKTTTDVREKGKRGRKGT